MHHGRKRVAVFIGGPSSEHEISIKTGGKVIENLDPELYDAHDVIVSKNGEWPLSPQELKEKNDVAFIAMHGEYGEDGTVQSFLDEIKMPYTGSGALSSALGMNKFLSLRHFADFGLTVPRTLLVSKFEWRNSPQVVLKKVFWDIEKPWVVKPNRAGSSVGVAITAEKDELILAFHNLFMRFNEVIVQTFIRGREVTCSVLDHGFSENAYALPPTEIIPLKGTFFDYQSKYEPKGSLEITPARFSDAWLRAIQRAAVAAHRAIGCRGMSRTDMIASSDGNLYVLEINTIPGMTETSLLPQAAQTHGISFPELLHRIIQAALPII